jgi:hypothetical protein
VRFGAPFYQSWARGASIFKMMEKSRHRSVETLRGYVGDAEIFKEHTGACEPVAKSPMSLLCPRTST